MRTVSNVQAKKLIGVVTVVLKSAHRKALAEAVDAVRLIVDTSAEFPDRVSEDPIVEVEIFEEELPGDLKNLSSRDDCGLPALQRIQELC